MLLVSDKKQINVSGSESETPRLLKKIKKIIKKKRVAVLSQYISFIYMALENRKK
jgi:hypothetical protein